MKENELRNILIGDGVLYVLKKEPQTEKKGKYFFGGEKSFIIYSENPFLMTRIQKDEIASIKRA